MVQLRTPGCPSGPDEVLMNRSLPLGEAMVDSGRDWATSLYSPVGIEVCLKTLSEKSVDRVMIIM